MADAKATVDADQAAAATAASQFGTASYLAALQSSTKHDSDIGSEESISFQQAENRARDRVHFDLAIVDARRHANELAYATARMNRNGETYDRGSSQQIIRHNDLAIDRQWNPDEVAQMTTIVAAVLAKMAKDD